MHRRSKLSCLNSCRPGLVVPCCLFAAVLVGSVGCEDQKSRMAMLEQTNMELNDEISELEGRLAAAQQSADGCQRELSSTQGQIGNLQRQLADARNRPAPPPQRIEPQVPAGWQAVPGGAMIAIDDSVLFDPGKASLKGEGDRAISSLVSELNGRYSGKDILVYGHTDNTPIKKSGWKDNYELSAQRSLAVVRKLSSMGVSGARLVACGCGEHRPRVPNSSESNRKRNRRVEIFALDAEVRTASR